MGFQNYRLRNIDIKLILYLAALSAIGVLAIGSAQPSLQNKQLMGVIAGFGIMLFVAIFDYHLIMRVYWLIYGVMIAALLSVILFGKEVNKAQRWLIIGGIQFQPSELAKILLILFFAAFIMKNKDHFNSFPVLMASMALFLVPFVLIYEQPDLSTSIMFILTFCVILFSGGLNRKTIIIALLIIVPIMAIGISLILRSDSSLLEAYQLRRVMAFLHPEQYPDLARQQNNSVTAIASGLLEGKGYRNNAITSVKNGNFLSEDQTDFIFAVIGEEFGFRGSLVTIVLLFLTALECISIGITARDTAGAVIASSMGALIAFQSFINIGVATFIMPNTGLPLPFVSYGLTSVISLYIGMGFVLNVKLQMKRGNPSAVEEIFG